MKQIVQDLKSGETILEELPAPNIRKGHLLIQTTRSLVSLGTEKMLVEFAKSNLIQKARQQPEKVKQVLDKIKTDGLMPTLEAVFNKLGEPLPLGYCNVGRVVAIGEGVTDFKVGDRVASNGHHAEIVCVPKNLVALIPDNVSDDEATFTVVGSIGLQGIRLLNPTLGEIFVVTGLGLIGLITAQLLLANGCKVIGIDIDESKLELARSYGVIGINPMGGNVVNYIKDYTDGVGADGVLITASAKNNDIIAQSAQMCRKRGRIVLVGVIGLELNRSDFYEKELTFQVSCSYGPGRYDEDYEQKGNDYPIAFVRWTEKRNFETILQTISAKKISVNDLITEIISLPDYKSIYGNLGSKNSIASIIKYESYPDILNHNVRFHSNSFDGAKGVIGIIGAGNFTKMTMLPALRGSGASLKSIASKNGLSGTVLAKKYNFANSTTSYQSILEDPDIDLVFITTRHNMHASMTIEALKHQKHVFVEKPLALNTEELEQVIEAFRQTDRTVTVGFNRRFSPHSIKMKMLIGDGPINVIATMNAGFIPQNVWVHDLEIGGGRIVGEACHYIDLITYLTGSRVKSVCMNALGQAPDLNTDNASILLKYHNGSTGVINYFSNGSAAYSKERVEVYSQGRTLIMDNFRETIGYGFSGFSSIKTKMDKGHKNQFHSLINAMKQTGQALIPFDELVNTSRSSYAALESLSLRQWVDVE